MVCNHFHILLNKVVGNKVSYELISCSLLLAQSLIKLYTKNEGVIKFWLNECLHSTSMIALELMMAKCTSNVNHGFH